MRWAAAILSVVLVQTSVLSTDQTRDVIQAIGTSLRDGYLDAETGRRLAELLEAKRAGGEFNAINNAGELATALTNLLQAETRDRHLRVTSRSASPSAPDGGGPRRMIRRTPGTSPGERPSMVGRVQMLADQVGYLEVRNFAGNSFAEFDQAMASLKSARALVIDVGQCPGGGPQAVQHLSTYLFSRRTHLVNTISRGMSAPSERWTLESVPGSRLPDVPVYILTSKRTFSAAESFTFGLRVTGRAVIVGEKTGGGGHFGSITPLPHGFEMFLPMGRTYDPRTGRGWEAEGILPDIEVPYADALPAAITDYRARITALRVSAPVVSLVTPPSQDKAKGSSSVDEVFQQYVAALGGERALNKVTRRTMTGTVEYIGVGQHGTAPAEIYWEAPDKFYAVIRAPFGLIEQRVNGSEGWANHPQTGSRKLSSQEMLEARRQWFLYQPFLLRDLYPKMRSEGKTRLDGREFDVISGETKQGTERFYFDVVTHLPARVDLWEEGPEAVRAGEFYLAHFYLADYRELDGIKVPFSIRRVRPNSEVIYTFREIVHNVPIDAKLFSPQRKNP